MTFLVDANVLSEPTKPSPADKVTGDYRLFSSHRADRHCVPERVSFHAPLTRQFRGPFLHQPAQTCIIFKAPFSQHKRQRRKDLPVIIGDPDGQTILPCTELLNRCTVKSRTEGSNPSLSVFLSKLEVLAPACLPDPFSALRSRATFGCIKLHHR